MTRELTGRHVLAITVAAFGLIFAVNGTMAILAVGSFPGLEVPNSYVASQHFDRDQRAQAALGWTARASYDGHRLEVSLADEAGVPPVLRGFKATVGRATHKRADMTPAFVLVGGVHQAPLTLEPGRWIIQIEAIAEDGTAFRQRLGYDIAGGM